LLLALILVGGCLGGDPPSGREKNTASEADIASRENVTRTEARPTGPDWAFTDTDGVQHTRNSSAGLPSVLFFMASWCSSCRTKSAVIANVNDTYWPDGLQTFTLAFDSTDDDSSLEAWRVKYGQPWPHGIDAGFKVQKAFGITSQSSVVVLDARGEVVKKFGYNTVTETALESAVEQAFTATAP
jgi:peroxiredoxin